MTSARAPKPDAEALRLAIQKLGFPSLDDDLLERFASELEGILKVTAPLERLDVSQAESARVFVNRGG